MLLAKYNLLIFCLLQMPETCQPRELLAVHAQILRPSAIEQRHSPDAGITCVYYVAIRIAVNGIYDLPLEGRNFQR